MLHTMSRSEALDEEIVALTAIGWDGFKVETVIRPKPEPSLPAFVASVRIRGQPDDVGGAGAEVELAIYLNADYPASPPASVAVTSPTASVGAGNLQALQLVLAEKIKVIHVRGEVCLHDIFVEAASFLTNSVAPTPLTRLSEDDVTLPNFPPVEVLRDAVHPLTAGARTRLTNLLAKDLVAAAIAHAKAEAKRSHCFVVHSHPILRRDLLKRFLDRHAALLALDAAAGVIMSPTLAFHATPDGDVLPKIVEQGLLSAGTFTPEGELLYMNHGNLFGDGIYVSPYFDMACWYGNGDDVFQQTLVVAVLPGRMRQIKPIDYTRKWAYIEGLNDVKWKLGEEESHISPNRHEYVLHDEDQVLPLALITFGNSTTSGSPSGGILTYDDWVKSSTSLLVDYDSTDFKDEVARQQKEKKALHARPNANIPTPTEPPREIYFDHVPGSPLHWTVTLTPALLHTLENSAQSQPVDLRLYLLLDRSASMRRSLHQVLLPSCAQLVRRLRPSRTHALMFGTDVATFSNVPDGFFESTAAKSVEVQKGTNVLGAYKAAVEMALKAQEEWKKEGETEVVKAARRDLERAEKEKAEKEKVRSSKRLEKMEARQAKEGGEGDQRDDENKKEEEDEEEKLQTFKRAYQKALKCADWKELVHVFVLLSDGVDTENSDADFDKVFDDYGNRINGAGLKTMFKIVGIGSKSDTRMAIKAKLATETAPIWESSPISYCRKVHEVPLVVANLSAELERALVAYSSSVHISSRGAFNPLNGTASKQPTVFSGFLSKWTSLPTDAIEVRRPDTNAPVTVLYIGGRPPSTIRINHGSAIRVLTSNRPSSTPALLELFGRFASDAKVATVARMPGHADHAASLASLIAAIKEAQVSELEVRALDAAGRVALMRRRRTLVTDLEGMLNQLRVDGREAVGAMTSEEAAKWLMPISRMRHGVGAVKRSAGAVEPEEVGRDLEVLAAAV
ncbi:hypothetical protein HK101_001837, partial [Irineochytrium annulatum]